MMAARPILEETVPMQIQKDMAMEGKELSRKLARAESSHINPRS